jgi:hypothetical protein
MMVPETPPEFISGRNRREPSAIFRDVIARKTPSGGKTLVQHL